jgi:diacylglycerol kinase family enzyme
VNETLAPLADAPSQPEQRPIAVVLNGAAGALLSRADALEHVTDSFARAGLAPEFVPLDAGTLPQRMTLARRMDPCAVVVAGGDGTIACAAQALAGTETPLGILPYGTMNFLAKDLGIPVDAPDAAARIVAEGRVREIDVGEVNGRVFLCASMLGLPARIGRFREKERARTKGLRLWTRVCIATLRFMRRTLPGQFVIEADDGAHLVGASAITVSVNPVDEPGRRALGRSCLADGELVVYVVDRLKVVDAARLAASYLRGTWRSTPILHEFRAKTLTLRTGRPMLRVMNDGENTLLKPPLTYRIRRKALRVFAPPPPA